MPIIAVTGRTAGVGAVTPQPPIPGAKASHVSVWLVSAVQQENVNSTTHLLHVLAEALGRRVDLGVLSPRRSHPLVPADATATNGRYRLWLADRTRRALLGSLEVAFSALRLVRGGNVLLVVTNPPVLPILMTAVAALRRAHLIVVVHDVYPDVLHVLGVLRRGSLRSRVFDGLMRGSLRRADRVVVIGRDMHSLIEAKLGGDASHVVCLPNWADTDVAPVNVPWHRRQDANAAPLSVQYSGNMGATHPVEILLETAERLQEEAVPARLQIYGWGLKHGLLSAGRNARDLRNMDVGGACERSELNRRLGSCDIALILMRRGMTGVSVPSRLYNILAAGKPLIVSADEGTEAAMLVREHGLGWVVEPENPRALAAAVRDAVRRRDELPAMGTRAAWLAAHQYSFSEAVDRYMRVIEDVARC
ncbi:glycosyltransferase family 4 protein [soil metagenome]